MRPADIKKLLKTEPFSPLRLGLSDGRAVIIRHPDQVVVAERHLLVGLARIARSTPLQTPRTGGAVARDWLIVNLLHIATIEPDNGTARGHAKSKKSSR
ncbi:MAG: hypothetical protein IIB59_02475 [Planctomycetes bacterium]|nr:hypothetical protein [Planctomycetota bacterium]